MINTRYIIAYRNKHTEAHAERANLLTPWVKLGAVGTYDEIVRLFEFECSEFSEQTAIAVFISRETNTWYNTKPRRIHNAHVLVSDADIRAAFGGLINAAQSGVV